MSDLTPRHDGRHAVLYDEKRRDGLWRRGRLTDKPGYRDSMRRFWSEPSSSALEILGERFAKGEIDKQEYEEKKAAIASSG